MAITRAMRHPGMNYFTGLQGRIRPWYGVTFVLRSWFGRLRGTRVDHLAFDRETGDLALCYMLFRVDRRPPGSAEVGLWTTRPYWGTKLSDEAAAPYFPAMFRALGIRRIVAVVDETNIQAIKATEQASRGWQLEGTLREAQFRNGAWSNMRVYSLLPTDWGVVEHLTREHEDPA